MMDRLGRELVLISLLAAFCAGLAWHHDQKLFAAAFAVAGLLQVSRRARGEAGMSGGRRQPLGEVGAVIER
jgi:hypothetical protein